MTNCTALLSRLREIVSQEPWDIEVLAEWADDFLTAHSDDFWERWDDDMDRQYRLQMSILKPLVGGYQHDSELPPLPKEPDDQLHGIGFIYDEDRDDRVLIAIDQLKRLDGLVAVSEHEGRLSIYSRTPIGLTDNTINVCGDEWVIAEFSPQRGRWEPVPAGQFRNKE